jgi:hypothetical protein
LKYEKKCLEVFVLVQELTSVLSSKCPTVKGMKMYTSKNFKSKKALKEALKNGEEITVYAPGLGEPPVNGVCAVSGPHYPAPHTWYAEVTIKDGLVVKVK